MISHLNNFLSGASAESVRSRDTKILALSFTPEAAELREAGSSLLEIVSIQDLGVKTFLPSLPSDPSLCGRETPKLCSARERRVHKYPCNANSSLIFIARQTEGRKEGRMGGSEDEITPLSSMI